MIEIENPLLNILNQGKSKKTPLWLMRQAGRYLPEYREIRKNFRNFLEFCFTPDAAAEVTLQPLKRFDLDAAIIFSDILTIPHALGVNVLFKENEGPFLETVDSHEKIKQLGIVKIKDLEKVFEAIKIVKNEIKNNYPGKSLIGFAGAPWTIACYMVQGKSDNGFKKVISFSLENPNSFQELINKIIEITILYLKYQIINGVDIIKIFDSWAGILGDEQYRRWVIEPTKIIIEEIKKEFPKIKIIGFPRNSGDLYIKYAEETGVDCLSISDDVSIEWALKNVKGKIIQGNFSNIILATSKEQIKNEVGSILRCAYHQPYIFNLNHGILPNTPIENVEHMIETVRNFKHEGCN